MENATAIVCDNLATFGATIGAGEIDNRPLPEQADIDAAVACLFEPVTGSFDECPLAQDLDSMLWGLVNAFHAQLNRLDRALDSNERTQADLRDRHDGSEVANTALQDALDQGRALLDRRNAFVAMYEAAAREFESATDNIWRPRNGSRPKSAYLTAAVIDSRDFQRARATKWTEDHLPSGRYVVFSGGREFQDADAVWNRLDRVKAKYPDMVLLHGGAPGADVIAAKWADARQVTQIKFHLDRQRWGNRAGFKRNEKMLDTVPVGVITFPGNGVTKALIREARGKGFKVWDYDTSQKRCGTMATQPDAKAPDTHPTDVIARRD